MKATDAPGGVPRPAPPRKATDARELRERVLAELAAVKGRVELASETSDPRRAKEQIRVAHSAQREARFAESADWIIRKEPALLEHFANGAEIDPAAIEPVVVPVRTQTEADLFRYATLQWSVPVSAGYGRRSRFLVRDRQNGKLIAVFSLGDPVIAQRARDDAIGWDKASRNARLYNVYDAYVLGAVEPYRQLLGGKLAALLTLSNEVRDFLTAKYAGNTTGISKVVKDPTPVLITTSSALGRSSVYNRVTFEGQLMFRSVGFTQGFGHFQFSDALFNELLDFVRNDVLTDPKLKIGSATYGSGPNWRFRVIRTALKALDIDTGYLQHNVKREVFLAPTAAGWDEYLRGERPDYEPFDLPVEKIGRYYRERWAVGRAERMPGFRFWRREEGRLAPSLGGRQHALGVPAGPAYGRVDLGAYSIAIGTGRRRVVRRRRGGDAAGGWAYLSRLEGPDVHVELADVTWDSGARAVFGISGPDTGPPLRVETSASFRNLAVVELRTPSRRADSVATRAASPAVLRELLGFDVEASLERLAEVAMGPRSAMLGDESASRRRSCAVFPAESREAAAVLWALTRPLALLASDGSRRPAEPRLRRPAPREAELDVESGLPLEL